MDISMNAAKGLEEEAGRHVNGTIEDHTIFFYGTCGIALLLPAGNFKIFLNLY